MPIVQEDPAQRPVPKPDIPQIAKDVVKLNVVDTNYVPQQSLLTSIEGSPWKVDFYSQVIADDNGLHGQGVTRDAVYQQYKLTRGLIIRVTSPLTASQDTEQKTMLVEGSATMYPGIVPNEGDMFVADIGDGRAGIFQIKHSERKTIFKDTCYAIEYVLIDYATEERLGDLVSKVVDTMYFVMDFMDYGQTPYLHTTEYVALRELQLRSEELVEEYFWRFTNVDRKTLLLPNQKFRIYDAWLTPFMMRAFTLWDVRVGRDNRVLNVQDDPVMALPTLWDALSRQDPKVLKRASNKVGLVSSRSFTNEPLYEGIYYSGVSYVVYPTNPVTGSQFEYDEALKSVNDALIVPSGYATPAGGYIKPVFVDDSYVFSQAFYTQAPVGQSALEVQTWAYLNNKPLDHQLLVGMLNDIANWGELECFYYIPILLVLIKASIRGL